MFWPSFLHLGVTTVEDGQVYQFLQNSTVGTGRLTYQSSQGWCQVSSICLNRHTSSYRYWCTRKKITSKFCKKIREVHIGVHEVWKSTKQKCEYLCRTSNVIECHTTAYLMMSLNHAYWPKKLLDNTYFLCFLRFDHDLFGAVIVAAICSLTSP